MKILSVLVIFATASLHLHAMEKLLSIGTSVTSRTIESPAPKITFSHLPPETVAYIASFMPKHDVRNVRLVNKQCAQIIKASNELCECGDPMCSMMEIIRSINAIQRGRQGYAFAGLDRLVRQIQLMTAIEELQSLYAYLNLCTANDPAKKFFFHCYKEDLANTCYATQTPAKQYLEKFRKKLQGAMETGKRD